MNILVLMSGGVDSSVSARLLLEKGHKIKGLYLKLYDDSQYNSVVQKIADKLRIELIEADIRDVFQNKIIDYFISYYSNGKTPNPCVLCNHIIKLKTAFEIMKKLGFDAIATGHYARIFNDLSDSFFIQKGIDPKKDQSYFLHNIPKEFLKFLIFPLGDMTKELTMEQAKKFNFTGHIAKESQDICFLKDDYRDFLKKNKGMPDKPGNIIDLSGKILGKHKGLLSYTTGQRGGIGIPDATPYYVKKINIKNNTLIVCKKNELFENSISIKDVNWFIPKESAIGKLYDVKIRYKHKGEKAMAIEDETSPEIIKLNFKEPVLSPAPGQFAVLYDNDIVIAGGEIC